MFHRPFFVNKIPNSNLLLIVINKINDTALADSSKSVEVLSTKPFEMETGLQYGVPHPCHKLYMNTFERRRLDECFVSYLNCSMDWQALLCFRALNAIFSLFYNHLQTEHPDEEETAYCGMASHINFTTLLILLPMFYLVRFSFKWKKTLN